MQPGSPITWAFIAGLSVILLGFVLTSTYAWIANRRDRETAGAGVETAIADSAKGEGK
jgi:uncharacterized membrane protein (DUF485 family)